MSKENVVLFMKAANNKRKLKERLTRFDKTSEWVQIATDSGFEFTADEFHSVIEETIRKKINEENAVDEYLSAQQEIGAGELSRRMVKSFIGGVARTYDFRSWLIRRNGR